MRWLRFVLSLLFCDAYQKNYLDLPVVSIVPCMGYRIAVSGVARFHRAISPVLLAQKYLAYAGTFHECRNLEIL